tara:strand:- start:4200 stop:5021 length:822 start_codon:yes stop_codon:yes gene_type:complete
MKYLKLRRKKIDPDDLLGTFADTNDASELITEDTIVLEDDRPVLAYIRHVPMDLEPLRKSLGDVDWATGYRATKKYAVSATSKVFGYQPRLEIRNQACRIASLALETPDLHRMIEGWTKVVAKYYQELSPDTAVDHQKITDSQIKKRFHLAETMFTSGIVNKTNVLPYHYDSGNFKGAWSAMLGLKKHMEGGSLVIPEYDIALEIADGSLTFFDGQATLHGVTPIQRRVVGAERYTLVWYSLKKMWLCLTAKEEVELMNVRAIANAQRKALNK